MISQLDFYNFVVDELSQVLLLIDIRPQEDFKKFNLQFSFNFDINSFQQENFVSEIESILSEPKSYKLNLFHQKDLRIFFIDEGDKQKEILFQMQDCFTKAGFKFVKIFIELGTFYLKFPFFFLDSSEKKFIRFYHFPSEIVPNFLYLGGIESAQNEIFLQKFEIKHIFNMAKEVQNYFQSKKEMSHLFYHHYELEDLSKTDISSVLDETYSLISKAFEKQQKVFVHCQLGKSRSASVILFYLMKSNKWTYQQAYDFLSLIRSIYPNQGFIKQLKEKEEK
ncbi:dual-specificity protein phosphatase sdp1-related [Anaeramoeba ignava]|uniref:protein-tyrosine-phosphatase n=1 Tax=Anaeramoeba ignava TaxID=1746090 RepID=A0A9Q0L5I1_ANAIG|nr:dual-specificity protein phosphatase sdp1-related [Anaeramoeba ignava]